MLPYFSILYDTPLPLFVYGTLRTGQGNWRRLLKGNTVLERPAIAPNHVLHVVQYAFIADGVGEVIGDLIEIKPELYQTVMQKVDALEDFNPHTGMGWYVRVARQVLVADKPILAWTYHASPQVLAQCNQQNQIKSGDWLEYLAR